jgi:tetratricopeptide (TPR) repeat protein
MSWAGKLHLAEAAIAGFLETIREAQVPLEQVPLEQVPAKLEELAQRYGRLLEAVRTLESDDPQVQQLTAQAAAAIEAGPQRYAQAEELLQRAEMIDREATDRLEAAAERRKLNAAKTRAQRGELSLLRLDYESAIEHLKAATKTVPLSYPEVRVQYRCSYANALHFSKTSTRAARARSHGDQRPRRGR